MTVPRASTPPEEVQPEPGSSAQPPAHPRPGRPRSPWLRPRRLVPLLVALLLLPAVVSYAEALTGPGNDSLGVRSVEWLRDHGLRGLVNWVETHWYSAHQPPVGGRPRHWPVLAQPAPAGGHRTGIAHLAPPTAITPFVANPLPGEGVWQPTGRTYHGQPALYTAFMRPDPVHTSVVVGLAWIDPTLARFTFVPGLLQPGGPPGPWGGQVPPSQRPSLLATFNSAFKIQDSQGGYYYNGVTVSPLVNGIASLVIGKDGRATVGLWGRDIAMSPSVAVVRQNLHLLVDHGVPTPAAQSMAADLWGPTLGNAVYVWRSAIGVTADGALVYAAGNGMSVESLARLLAAAHCVRAMELDINPYWTNFYWYSAPLPGSVLGVTPHKLLPDMQRSLYRYLSPDSRDFVAVQIR